MMFIGVDEAGRGPLAGPVVAAAVILDPACQIAGLADSKTLSSKKREVLEKEIKLSSLAYGLGSASVKEIDELNILRATFLAMARAVEDCLTQLHSVASVPPLDEMCVQVDGNRSPADFQGPWTWPYPTETIVKGDQTIPAISAASILAKTARDRTMLEIHALHPEYGFDRHAGYGTAFHLAAIDRHGVLAIHRTTFSPITQRLAKQSS
jgi:ribonuclease HII